MKDPSKNNDDNEIAIIKNLQTNEKVSEMYVPRKKMVSLRIDEDILAVLKRDGKGYQTRINNILREVLFKNA